LTWLLGKEPNPQSFQSEQTTSDPSNINLSNINSMSNGVTIDVDPSMDFEEYVLQKMMKAAQAQTQPSTTT